jgi:hypothetical protein
MARLTLIWVLHYVAFMMPGWQHVQYQICPALARFTARLAPIWVICHAPFTMLKWQHI